MLRYLLYPGVIFHELMHYTMCIFLGVEVKGFKLGLKESYVRHNNTNTINITLIALAPFLLGNFLAFLFIIISIKYFTQNKIAFFVIHWLVISIIYYSIPSKQDTKNITSKIETYLNKLKKGNLLDVLLYPFFYIIIYLPVFVILELIMLFDKYEALRYILIFTIYFSVFYFY